MLSISASAFAVALSWCLSCSVGGRHVFLLAQASVGQT